MAAIKRGESWFIREDWRPYFDWLEAKLQRDGTWAVIPDAPGAPSQLNDALLKEWPFGVEKGVPLWHMDGPISRLGRLCEIYPRVALGWIGHPKLEPVGCDGYRRRMDEVAAFFGNRWHDTHMMRGILVAHDYPFVSADATSAAQNGHRYDSDLDRACGDPWRGRRAYADRLEADPYARAIRFGMSRDSATSQRRHSPSGARPSGDGASNQLGLWGGDGDIC